jgi:hypothetical protein
MAIDPNKVRSQISDAKKRLQHLLRAQQEANQEIQDLRELVRANANFLPEDERLREMAILDFLKQPTNIAEAVRLAVFFATILSQKITPLEIRAAAESFGFDFTEYSNPMASIHTILKRMREADPPQVDYDEEVGGYWFGDISVAHDVIDIKLFEEIFQETMRALVGNVDGNKVLATAADKTQETLVKKMNAITRGRSDDA